MNPTEMKMDLIEILEDAKVPANKRYAVADRIVDLFVPALLDMASGIAGAHGAHMVVPYIYQLRSKF